MRFLTSIAVAMAALAILGGCSNDRSQLPAVNRAPFGSSAPTDGIRASARKSTQYVFVSDYVARAVDVFKGTQQTGQLTGFDEPEGLATDRTGNLYVANTADRNVEEFAPPYDGSPIATVDDPDGFPTVVAISRAGLLAVVNICNGPNCDLPSTVHFYAKGNLTSPCATVSIFQTGLSGAFDDRGNLYVGGLSRFERSQVGVIAGGCKAKTLLALTPQYAVEFPGGLQVDTNDDVAILDSLNDQVDIFAPRAKPSTMLALLSTAPLNDTTVPAGFALAKDGKRFYIADFANHYTEEYAYPAGGSSIGTLHSNPSCECEGVGVAPAEFP